MASLESSLNKVIEVYKARMTVGLALMAGMTAVTSFALLAEKPILLLLAACVPLFALSCDLIILYILAMPFAYKAFVVEDSVDNAEPLGGLFLAYGSTAQARLEAIKKMEPGIARQKAFRTHYFCRNMGFKAVIFGVGCF